MSANRLRPATTNRDCCAAKQLCAELIFNPNKCQVGVACQLFVIWLYLAANKRVRLIIHGLSGVLSTTVATKSLIQLPLGKLSGISQFCRLSWTVVRFSPTRPPIASEASQLRRTLWNDKQTGDRV